MNISTHGASICCTKPLTKKILLRIKLTLNESVNFILKGKIIHIKKKEITNADCKKKLSYFQPKFFKTPKRLTMGAWLPLELEDQSKAFKKNLNRATSYIVYNSINVCLLHIS